MGDMYLKVMVALPKYLSHERESYTKKLKELSKTDDWGMKR